MPLTVRAALLSGWRGWQDLHKQEARDGYIPVARAFDCRSRRVSNPPLYDVLEGRVLERLLSEHIIKSWCRDCGSSWLTGPASNLYTNTHTDTPSPPSLTKEAKPVCMRNSIIVSDGRTPYNHLSKTTDSPRM